MRLRFSVWRLLLAFIDASGVVLLLFLAAVLHYEGRIPREIWARLPLTTLWAAGLVVLTNYGCGLYNRVWEYATAETALVIGTSVTVSLLAAALAATVTVGPLPKAIWVITWLGTLLAIGGIRFTWRIVRPRLKRAQEKLEGAPRRLLIYGAGTHGHMLATQLRQMNTHYELVGFIDDDPAKQGSVVGHARVLGGGEELARIVAKYDVDEVILAMPSASSAEMRRAYELCKKAGVTVKALPSLLELLEEPTIRRVREVRIEDLIGRELRVTSLELRRDYIRGKTILITGAGGSIGSELARQICRYGPRRVVLLGRGENRIHWIYWQLKRTFPDIDLVPVIANVTVRSCMEKVFGEYKPDVVIHAAAHKHVYLMESVPVEAARNNILGTALLAQLAEKHGCEKFIFVSTDKAVQPSCVMGATKRFCELLLLTRPFNGTDFICVRFGNVIGSEGSVLEIFKRQWANGEPLTVTHPDATRYFMSIPEACFLILQAGAIGKHGDLFLLEMGRPVRILDLAKEFIALQGGDPEAPGAIEFIGLRPGEKLHEELLAPDETAVTTECQFVTRVVSEPGVTWEEVQAWLHELEGAIEVEDEDRVVKVLAAATGARLRRKLHDRSQIGAGEG